MLDIVIVNWNSDVQLLGVVTSIAACFAKTVKRVIVVDNDSTDDSLIIVEASETDLPFSLRIIRNPTNQGFGAACNQGARQADGEFVLFLNPDIRLFADSLSVPLAFMEASQNQSVGICGIQLLDDSGNVSRSCARFPTPGLLYAWMLGFDKVFPHIFPSQLMREWGHDTSMDVDQVIGAFFLVRRKLFDQLNGFDERFFVYQEEVDFSLRARRLGWRSHYLAEAKAYHKGGGSSGKVKARRLFYSLRSRILYGYKHFGRFQATAVLLGTLLLEPFSRIALNLLHCSFKSAGETLSAYLMLYQALPALISGARKK